MSGNILEIKNLNLFYHEMEIVQDVSLHVDRNEFVSLLGPSGCGKSTIFNVISGLVIPEKGQVLFNGENTVGKVGNVSYMYQKDLLLEWRKIIDNVILPLTLSGMKKNEAYEKVLPYFDIFQLTGFEYHYPSQLSGGMRQRAALMRTYMCGKSMLLLDEPFGSLDAMTKLNMQKWLKDVQKKFESSVFFITHDIDEAIYLSDRIYVLSSRPASVIDEIRIDLDKTDFLRCTTSPEFNEIKKTIMELLQ